MRPSNRRGVFIGLVLAILVVFAILSIFIMSSGTSEYNQTMIVAHRLKADLFLHAVLEESLAVLYDRVNRPDDGNLADDVDNSRNPPPWKAELFEEIVDAVDQGGGNIEIGPIAEYNLYDLGLIPESSALVEGENEGVIEQCKVEFEGFRRIWYSPSGFFNLNRDKVYYKDPLAELDASDYEYPYPNDYQGYATIKIKIAFGSGPVRVERHLASSYDIKVVNQTPSARRFGVFQWYPVTDEDVRDHDLNLGGGLKIFPRDKARLYVRGPYITDTYGEPDGSGGDDAPTNKLTYWEGGDWHGWSLMPSPRAGIMNASIFQQFPMARPDDTSGTLPLIGMINVGGLLNGVFDPGFALQNGQQWFCANQDQSDDKITNAFSLFGDSGDMQTYSGIHCKIEDDGTESSQEASEGGGWPSGDGDIEERWVKRVEGVCAQRCNMAEYSYWEISFLFGPAIAHYSVDITGDEHLVPYGGHYMPNAEGSMFAAWVSFVCDAVMTVATIATLGAASAAQSVAYTVFQSAMVSTGTHMGIDAMQDNFQPGPYSMGANPDDYINFYPPHHRDYMRTTTRWYHSLDHLRSWSEDPNDFPVLLDGTIFVKDMGEQHWFQYVGRGMIVSENTMGDASYNNPSIEGPIKAFTSPNIDHLNLIYLGAKESASQGSDLLYVRAAPSAEVTVDGADVDDQETFIDGSVYSTQGVAPDVNETPDVVTIGGNYICGYFNKFAIPEGSQLHVQYNTNWFPEEEDEINAFHDGRWHNLSMSFRTSGWYDQKRWEE